MASLVAFYGSVRCQRSHFFGRSAASQANRLAHKKQMFSALRVRVARASQGTRGFATKPPSALGKAWAIDLIKDAAGVSGKQAEVAYKALLEGVSAAVASGERVTFQGFGTFEKTSRAARNGVNPQTGAAIQIPATEAPKFKAGTAFKMLVKGK